MMLSTSVIKVAMCVLAVKSIIVASTLVESPQSTTKKGGEIAVFNCAGNGTDLYWIVDESWVADASEIKERGIRQSISTNSDMMTVKSNLTIPATTINNGTTVLCTIVQAISQTFFSSNNATLTVLPGIGKVLELRFNRFFNEVMWEKPLTAGVSDDQLQYNLTVTNLNINSTIIDTTTNKTKHSVYSPEYCTRYLAIVLPFVYDHLTGKSVSVIQKSPGDFYDFVNIVVDVADVGIQTTINVSLRINLMLEGLLPCPGQKLIYQSHPRSNVSDIVNHTEVMINKDHLQYNFTTEFERKQLHTAIFSRISDEGNIEVWMFNFSTFDIQGCDLHNDHSSILVECTFIINSTAPGFVVIRDEQGYTTSKMLQRLEDDTKGSANITGLSSGEYSVTVFDQIEDSDPAYENETVLYQLPSTSTPTPTSTPIPTSTAGTDASIVKTVQPTSTLESSPPADAALSDSTNTIIISAVLSGIIIALMLVIVIIIFILAYQKTERRKEYVIPMMQKRSQ